MLTSGRTVLCRTLRQQHRHLHREAGLRIQLPLLKLPAVLFPEQSLSLSVCEQRTEGTTSFDVPRSATLDAWQNHGGAMCAFGPTVGGSVRVGAELHLFYDNTLESVVPTPPDIAHGVGGRRLRLVRIESGPAGLPYATLEHIQDTPLTPARAERLADEADEVCRRSCQPASTSAQRD